MGVMVTEEGVVVANNDEDHVDGSSHSLEELVAFLPFALEMLPDPCSYSSPVTTATLATTCEPQYLLLVGSRLNRLVLPVGDTVEDDVVVYVVVSVTICLGSTHGHI